MPHERGAGDSTMMDTAALTAGGDTARPGTGSGHSVAGSGAGEKRDAAGRPAVAWAPWGSARRARHRRSRRGRGIGKTSRAADLGHGSAQGIPSRSSRAPILPAGAGGDTHQGCENGAQRPDGCEEDHHRAVGVGRRGGPPGAPAWQRPGWVHEGVPPDDFCCLHREGPSPYVRNASGGCAKCSERDAQVCSSP